MPDADLSLRILNGTSNFFDRFDAGPDAPQGTAVKPGAPTGNFFDQFDSGPDALTERALSMLNAAAPQKPQTSGTDALTDRALWMLSASPDDLKQMAASIQAPERPSLGTRALAGANTGLIAQTLGMQLIWRPIRSI